MIPRQLKQEIMDAVQSAVSEYLKTTRGANFGNGATVKRPRSGSVMITGIKDEFSGERSAMEIIIEEVKHGR